MAVKRVHDTLCTAECLDVAVIVFLDGRIGCEPLLNCLALALDRCIEDGKLVRCKELLVGRQHPVPRRVPQNGVETVTLVRHAVGVEDLREDQVEAECGHATAGVEKGVKLIPRPNALSPGPTAATGRAVTPALS